MNSMMPFPFLMPFPAGPQGSPQGSEPPARVRAAMEFLCNLSMKTRSVVAVSDIAIEEFAGQVLTAAETEAQQTACRMLSSYFKGNLPLDFWEELREKRVGQPLPSSPGMVIRCAACAPGPTQPDCVLCHGAGQLLIFPTSGSPEGAVGL